MYKFVYRKANRALLLAAEEIYGSSLQRSELFLHLRCRPCKRRLKNFIALKTLISESQRSLERFERFIEESLSAVRSLKTSEGRNDSVARVSRGTRRGLDSNSVKQILFYGWQSYKLESLPTETKMNIFFLSACLVESLGSLSKHDVDGSENVTWKCNFGFLQSFFNYSKPLCSKNVF